MLQIVIGEADQYLPCDLIIHNAINTDWGSFSVRRNEITSAVSISDMGLVLERGGVTSAVSARAGLIWWGCKAESTSGSAENSNFGFFGAGVVVVVGSGSMAIDPKTKAKGGLAWPA